MTPFDADFQRAIVLKVAFHADRLVRCQAAMLYAALEGAEFMADEVLPAELTANDDGSQDTHVAGVAVAALRCAGLLERAVTTENPAARRRSASPSRNGAWGNVWRLACGKRETARTWLARNRFPLPEPRQQEMALT